MDHDHEEDAPILELDDEDRVPTTDDTPIDDLPVLSRADEDEDFYELNRPQVVAKPKPPQKQRTRQPAPARSPRREASRPRSKGPSLRLLAIVGVIGLCAVIGFITLGVLVIRKSGEEDAVKVADMVRNHPVVIEQLGGIDECKMNFWDSLNEEGTDTDVFDVRGPKGRGQFVTEESLFVGFFSIRLRTVNGEWELLDDHENEDEPDPPVVTPHVNPPAIAHETNPSRTQPPPVVPTPPRTVSQPPSQWAPLPKGFVVANGSTPLKPGTPVKALFGATWHPAEVLAVTPDGNLSVHWPHLGHNLNRSLPRSMVALSEETLAKLTSEPEAFTPSVELPEGSLFPPPDGYVVVPKNLKLLPGTPVKLARAGRSTIDYTVVAAFDDRVTVLRDQAPFRDELHPRRKLVIAKSVIEQLAEPETEKKFSERLVEVRAKNRLPHMDRSNAARAIEEMRKNRPAREYRITIPIPETAERVTKETPLAVGTRCSAEWGRRWNPVTVMALRENGDVEVQWEGWSSIEPVTRNSLTIDKTTLADLLAKQKLKADDQSKPDPANEDGDSQK
jgi:hypothetical protein